VSPPRHSSLRRLAKQWIPPILLQHALQIRSPTVRYGSFEEAMAACGMGYESRSLTEVVVKKNLRLRREMHAAEAAGQGAHLDLSAVRTLVALGLCKRGRTLNVLDFGGGAGTHYLIARAALGPEVSLRWNVVESSEMVHAANVMADGQLRFYDDLEPAREDLGQIDLVLASSALQYVRDPFDTLRRLTTLGARSIFITRTPFSADEGTHFFRQESLLSDNGPGPLPQGQADAKVHYPLTLVPRSRVERALSDSYAIRLRLSEERDVRLVPGVTTSMYGYYCEKAGDH
jgi:putative methyltransferase (TIGR04325 family)